MRHCEAKPKQSNAEFIASKLSQNEFSKKHNTDCLDKTNGAII
jgi:hypothetical protein